jgi:hypothetical protein
LTGILTLYRRIKKDTSISESIIKLSTEEANAALSKAAPPPFTWYQLKKNAKEDVTDMIIPIATTGELYLGCIQPTILGSMSRSERTWIESNS